LNDQFRYIITNFPLEKKNETFEFASSIIARVLIFKVSENRI